MNSSHTPLAPRDSHRMRAAVPAVEIADHAHALGVRRPHARSARPRTPSSVIGVRAEHAVGLVQPARVEQIQIVVGDRRRESVGIGALALAVLPTRSRAGHAAARRRASRTAPAGARARAHSAAALVDERDALGVRMEHAQHPAVAARGARRARRTDRAGAPQRAARVAESGARADAARCTSA